MREGDAADARVTIIRDGVQSVIEFHAHQGNVLDAAAAAGLEVPFSCKSGVCCTCRAKLLEGEVRMERNFALEKHEVAAGFVLTCQAHPLTERDRPLLRRALIRPGTPTMPRGRARGYDDQREQILARAAKLFARRGYTATSMNEVAEACGVSKPSLYHYFRDKQQLLLEIAAAHVARLEALVEEVAAEAHEPEARVRRLISAFLEVYAGAQAEHRVLTEDVRFLPPADRRRVLDGERKVVAAFADAIAAARPALRAHELDKPLTMLLFGMMNWMFTWLKPRGELSHADMAPVVADLFFGGLGAVRAPGAPSLSLPPSPTHNGDSACLTPPSSSSRSASPSRPR